MTERSDKRLLRRCTHAPGCECDLEVLAAMQRRWCADTPDLAAARAMRERVELAAQVPALAPTPTVAILSARDLHGDQPPRGVLGVAIAWACVVLSALVMLALAVRTVWVIA